MLVAELPGDTGRRLGVVGSCRLHDPLKAGVRDHGGRFVWSAYNAFSHSPEEALQHLRICLGEIEMPDPFAPYMIRQERAPLFPETLEPLIRSLDALVVEVSSFELLRCGSYLFNQDYFAQTFVRGKGLALLNWFRTVGSARPSAEAADAAEAAMADGGTPASPSRREVLRTLRKIPSPDDGATAIAALSRLAPKVIFCPIFNIAGVPDRVRDERAAVAEKLRRGATATGSEFLDPSELLAGYDRKEVLDGDGADLFHYSPAFLPTIGALLLREINCRL